MLCKSLKLPVSSENRVVVAEGLTRFFGIQIDMELIGHHIDHFVIN